MNPNDYLYQQDASIVQAQQEQLQQQQRQQDYIIQEAERSMIKDQLDLGDELERIENLLYGRVLVRNKETGKKEWQNPPNNDDVLLSESGINLVLNAIQWYLNKNTLLSNYEEEVINGKMEDFATALADVLFMKYEKYFLYPTDEECQQKLIERLKKKRKEIQYSMELHDLVPDSDKIWKKLVSEIDDVEERKKIREQTVKDKLKNYELLLRLIQDSVHSAYLRAWKGQERRTLRQHIHISETRNPNLPSQQQRSNINPLNLFRR